MKQITVTETKRKLTNSDIKLLEEKLGVTLPEDYKMFLLKHNGGGPVKDIYPIIEIYDFNRYGWGSTTVHDCEINKFYSIYDGEHDNFVQENTFNKTYSDIPDDLILIGCSSVGDQICIGVKESNFGKVYYWGHDWESGKDSLSFVLVANSFTDFINSLYKFIDIKEDVNGEKVWVYGHDKYSLPVCTEAKKYGSIFTEFFANAPVEVEEYIIEEPEPLTELTLYYDVKSTGKRYKRIIKEDQTTVDSVENLE